MKTEPKPTSHQQYIEILWNMKKNIEIAIERATNKAAEEEEEEDG